MPALSIEHFCPLRIEHGRLERLPSLLHECDSKCTAVLEVEDGILAYGDILCNRTALYQALNADNDREAYERVLAALGSPREPPESSFAEHYREAPLSTVAKLPATRFYDCDGGPYLTGAVVIACWGGVCNASIHRMMRVTDTSFTVRVVPRHLHRMLREAGGKLPVAVALGVNPLFMLGSATSPPYGVFEAGVARSLGWRGSLCRTPRYAIPVPCDARIVLEGVLGPERAEEGPFADILLLCDRVRREPILRVEAVYESKMYERGVWQILPGGEEHRLLMGFPREALIWDAVRRAVGREPTVRLLRSGGGWLAAAIAFEDISAEDAKIALMAAFSAHPSLKAAIVTLNDVDVENPDDVLWSLFTRVSSSKDVFVIEEVRVSSLDPSAQDGRGVKIGIVAVPRGDKARFTRPRLLGVGGDGCSAARRAGQTHA